MRRLVLWSGGVESTSTMKYLLSETTDQVVAHFIRVYNSEGRIDFEANAVHTLTPLLYAIRPFEYSESSINICGGKATGWDSAIHNVIGATAMLHHKCDTLHRCLCAEDVFSHNITTGEFTKKYENIEEMQGDRRHILDYCATGRPAEEIAPFLPHFNKTKAEHVAYLGDMFKFTWSCRRPVNGLKCGACHTCLELQKAVQPESGRK